MIWLSARLVAAGAQPVTWLGMAGELSAIGALLKWLGEVGQILLNTPALPELFWLGNSATRQIADKIEVSSVTTLACNHRDKTWIITLKIGYCLSLSGGLHRRQKRHVLHIRSGRGR